MSSYRVWYSTEQFADMVIDHTSLRSENVVKRKMYESDANNSRSYHTMPDHIKQILYLDAPDLIVELDHEPLFSIEVSTEAGTGHNVFQRFARLAASVENQVPAFYLYPEAVIVTRKTGGPKWDVINPLIFRAMENVMSIYNIPALLYYYPTDFRSYPLAVDATNRKSKGIRFDSRRRYLGCPEAKDKELLSMFETIDDMLSVYSKYGVVEGRKRLNSQRSVIARRALMNTEYCLKHGSDDLSPLSATVKVPTKSLLHHLSRYERKGYTIGELLRSRSETVIYKVDAKFRGDPYPGALAAIDYLVCRQGRTFEDRKYNLVLAFCDVSLEDSGDSITLYGAKGKVEDFVQTVQRSEDKNILRSSFTDLQYHEIPRYYMQVRYGSMFSKAKHIRVYSYFADAILFPDGAFWRDA
jgi:hypothetical protein